MPGDERQVDAALEHDRDRIAMPAGSTTMTGDRIVYHFAVLRAVPHPHLATFVPVGVVLHARTADYLGFRAIDDEATLRARVRDVDVDLFARYLESAARIAAGDAAGGPVALLPPSERFHWLTAPRSDVIQPSPVHAGITHDPAAALETLFAQHVGGAIR